MNMLKHTFYNFLIVIPKRNFNLSILPILLSILTDFLILIFLCDHQHFFQLEIQTIKTKINKLMH